jgi:hypothetical protein
MQRHAHNNRWWLICIHSSQNSNTYKSRAPVMPAFLLRAAKRARRVHLVARHAVFPRPLSGEERQGQEEANH